MQAVVLSFLLLAGGPPQAPPANGSPMAVAEDHGGVYYVDNDRSLGLRDDLRHAFSLPLVRWLGYTTRNDYSPGTLRHPDTSWYKHCYLAYRGNHYGREGYDYLRQFDYPWHPARSSRQGYVYPGGPPAFTYRGLPQASPPSRVPPARQNGLGPEILEPPPASPKSANHK